jgi:hypothetical protein
VGRRLLAEAKGIAGLDAAIRGLRAPDWIERNAHSPFRTWAASPRAAAQAAFSEAGARLRGCAGVDQVRQVIEAFVHALNAAHARHALETSEREDAAGAVDLLVREAGYQDLRADAQGWFDAVRSF